MLFLPNILWGTIIAFSTTNKVFLFKKVRKLQENENNLFWITDRVLLTVKSDTLDDLGRPEIVKSFLEMRVKPIARVITKFPAKKKKNYWWFKVVPSCSVIVNTRIARYIIRRKCFMNYHSRFLHDNKVIKYSHERTSTMTKSTYPII